MVSYPIIDMIAVPLFTKSNTKNKKENRKQIVVVFIVDDVVAVVVSSCRWVRSVTSGSRTGHHHNANGRRNLAGKAFKNVTVY